MDAIVDTRPERLDPATSEENEAGSDPRLRWIPRADFAAFIDELAFRRCGTIEVQPGGRLGFNLLDPPFAPTLRGFVYLWTLERAHQCAVAYVGKAGKTVRDRCRQHAQGFRGAADGGSGRGGIHAAAIRAVLAQGDAHIVVHARHAERTRILGQDDVSLVLAEEEAALIQRFAPPWNYRPSFSRP